MRFTLSIGSIIFFLLGCASTEPIQNPGGVSGGARESEWIPLANGRNLDAFEQIGSAAWETRMVPDGDREVPVIYGRNTRIKTNSYLLHKSIFEDFEYRVDMRTTPGVNSGAVFRIPEGTRGGFSSRGYEIQFCDSDSRHPTGSIYNIQPAPSGLHKSGDWNEIRVVCRGTRLQTWVNGEPAVDIENDRSSKGHFVFQVHGDPPDWYTTVEIKNPRVKPLP